MIPELEKGVKVNSITFCINPWLEGEPAILEMPGARAEFGGVYQEELVNLPAHIIPNSHSASIFSEVLPFLCHHRIEHMYRLRVVRQGESSLLGYVSQSLL